jgi:hypothetical protein
MSQFVDQDAHEPDPNNKNRLQFAYHAVAPHVIVDTPLVVKVFGIV